MENWLLLCMAIPFLVLVYVWYLGQKRSAAYQKVGGPKKRDLRDVGFPSCFVLRI